MFAVALLRLQEYFIAESAGEPGVLGSRVCLAPGTLSDLPQVLAFFDPPFLLLSWNANASNAGKL